MRTENTCASQPLRGITTISAIRYEVEIQPPSSIPAPIAPWMSASEALTIWMLSTAMKAPSVEATMAIQVLSEATGGAAGAVASAAVGEDAGDRAISRTDMIGAPQARSRRAPRNKAPMIGGG